MAEYEIPVRNRGARSARGDQPQRPAEVLTPTYLADAYQPAGLTTYQIAAESGFSLDTERTYMRRADIPMRWKGFTVKYHFDPMRLAALGCDGRSTQRIADEFGCSRGHGRACTAPPRNRPLMIFAATSLCCWLMSVKREALESSGERPSTNRRPDS
jgi:hypothetical protein